MTPKVLLVDDVSMFVELQKDYLQLSAVQILTARNGEEALRLCREQRPALVFMDLQMPVLNGAECCAALKKDPILRDTPVVLIASGKEGERVACLAAGCDAFLTKPLDRLVYLDMARRLLPDIDRRDKRVPCRINAKFRIFGVTLSGLLLDLSQGGAYLSTGYDLELGATVEMVFSLPGADGAIIQARGRVTWENSARMRQKPAHPEGYGIEFVNLPETSARALDTFIKLESFA